MTKLAQKILELHNQGKTKKEIASILNCNIATVFYNVDPNYKINEKLRYKTNPIYRKIIQFCRIKTFQKPKSYKTTNIRSFIYWKIRTFCTTKKGDKNVSHNFTPEDVIGKFGTNPKCYLTGQEIDISKPRTYEFDHIIPKSRGGQNTLDNLGICTKESNRAKQTMTPDELFNLCKIILEHQGYKIT